MKALVISGGGSKGAFAGGVAEYLINVKRNKYDIFIGTSVGSLLISHLALQKVTELKTIFSNINNKDVFNIYPFKVKEVDGDYKLKINHFNTIRAFLKGCSTFGESKNLRKLIKRVLSKDDFEKLKTKAQVIFTVSNLTQQQVEYKTALENNYEDFCDWMWASANFVPFMSLLKKNDCQYADGGFGSHVPVLKAIELGACEVDVIILDSPKTTVENCLATNPFQTLVSAFKFMSNQIGLNDVLIGKLKGRQSKIDIRMYNCPEDLTNNPLFFHPKQMTTWWEKGYNFAKTTPPVCHCFMPNGKVKQIKS
ncbi:patatin-like phospholipase family protein [Lutibacter sp.]|uniref:patatin-like phospholipase family protein n=1 Tax=Lutibacter sp. TaxID=1925666 RepID=UPI0025C38779|nr:patatin-like phospholipase family protein [Lutibacter sp.]MCF6181402.1 patatin-like phospholipase family protein [Lutibacter sp.]